jgi:hypothetical protein
MMQAFKTLINTIFSHHNLLVMAVVVLALVALAIWLYLGYFGWVSLQKRQQLSRNLTLVNNSNIPTLFHLQVDLGSLKDKIITAWFQENRPIKTKKVEQVNFLEETRPEQAVDPKKPVKTASPAGPSAKTPGQPANPQAAVMDRYRFLRTITSLIANICSTLASILPDSINGPLKSLADSIRAGQEQADQTVAQPKRLAASGNSLKSNVQSLNSKTGKAKTTQSSAQPTDQQPVQAQPVTPADEKQFRRTVAVYQVIETRTFAPAESSTFGVTLRPRNPFRKIACVFTINSQQVENADFPPYEILKAQTLSEDFVMNASASIHFVLFLTFCLAVLVFNLWWTLAIYQWLSKLLG